MRSRRARRRAGRALGARQAGPEPEFELGERIQNAQDVIDREDEVLEGIFRPKRLRVNPSNGIVQHPFQIVDQRTKRNWPL